MGAYVWFSLSLLLGGGSVSVYDGYVVCQNSNPVGGADDGWAEDGHDRLLLAASQEAEGAV